MALGIQGSINWFKQFSEYTSGTRQTIRQAGVLVKRTIKHKFQIFLVFYSSWYRVIRIFKVN